MTLMDIGWPLLLDLGLFALTFISILTALVLRAALARIEPVVQARLLPPSTKVPAAIEDLLPPIRDEVIAQGFEEERLALLDMVPPDCGQPTVAACWRHTVENTVVFASTPYDINRPNTPLIWVSTRLLDGRIATTQAHDAWFELAATPELPGHCVTADSVESLLEQHRTWVASLGSTIDRHPVSDSQLMAHLSELHNRRREAMLRDGRLWLDDRGLARPSLRAGLQSVYALLRRKRATASDQPVPVIRLVAFANLLEQLARHPLPLRTQWAFFLVTVAASLVIGAVFFGIEFALIILAVIIIHEAGHYLAMRAFGYHQVQMLMLPLVGGVTLGNEDNANVAHRVWISFAGPLPGIILAGIIFYLGLHHAGVLDDHSWVWTFAWVLLVVNLVNLLPIPPLDGGQIVQALLPGRSYRLKATFTVVASLCGILLGWLFGFYLLALIALLPLFSIPGILQNGRVMKKLLHRFHETTHTSTIDSPKSLQLRQILDALEQQLGPTTKVLPRIQQARQLLDDARLQSMPRLQHTLASALFMVVGVVPVAAVSMMWFGLNSQINSDTWYHEYSVIEEEQRTQAATLTDDEVIQALADIHAHSLAQGVDIDQIAVTEARLGLILPDELRNFYQQTDGFDPLGIYPLAQLQTGDACLVLIDDLKEYSPFSVYVNALDDINHDDPLEFDVADLDNWLCLSNLDEYPVFYAAHETAYPFRVISVFEGLEAYLTLNDWLRILIADHYTDEHFDDFHQAHIEARLHEFEQEDMASLIEALDWKLPWWARWFGDVQPEHQGASAQAINTLEQQYDLQLPPQYKQLLMLRDGFRQLYSLQGFEEALQLTNSALFDEALATAEIDTINDISRCLVVGGWTTLAENSTALAASEVDTGELDHRLSMPRLHPTLLMCPDDQNWLLVDLMDRRVFDDLLHYLRHLRAMLPD